MSAPTHARRRFPRLVALFGSKSAPARTPVPYLPGPPFAGGAPASPVHMVADRAGIMRCCGRDESEVPRTDRVTMRPELVTCRLMTAAEMMWPREAHGVATAETLAAIVAEAEAEAERNSIPPAEDPAAVSTAPWGPWD